MAVRKKKSSKVPEKLQELLRKAAIFKMIEKAGSWYYADTRAKIVDYIEHNKDGFDVDYEEKIKTKFITAVSKEKWYCEQDLSKLEKLITSKKIPISAFLQCVKINQDSLYDAMGDQAYWSVTKEIQGDDWLYLRTTTTASAAGDELLELDQAFTKNGLRFDSFFKGIQDKIFKSVSED